MAKLSDVLDALRNGAVLHLSLVKKPTWELHDGAAIKTINTRTVQSLLKRRAIVSAGDSLFPDIPSQTWRYAEPK